MDRSSLLVASSSSWSGPAIATLTMSILALTVSLVARGWQIISWRHSGARLHVAARNGFLALDDVRGWIGIEIRNTGRLSTEINQVGFQLSRAENRRQMVQFDDAMGERIVLPRRLDAGATVTIHYDVRGLLELLDSEGVSGVGARADTAHGRTRSGRVRLREWAHTLAG